MTGQQQQHGTALESAHYNSKPTKHLLTWVHLLHNQLSGICHLCSSLYQSLLLAGQLPESNATWHMAAAAALAAFANPCCCCTGACASLAAADGPPAPGTAYRFLQANLHYAFHQCIDFGLVCEDSKMKAAQHSVITTMSGAERKSDQTVPCHEPGQQVVHLRH